MSDQQTSFLRVHVHASQRVHYDQVLVIRADDWAELKADRERDACESILDRLDLRDVSYGDDLESFTATVVDANDKPVLPADELEAES